MHLLVGVETTREERTRNRRLFAMVSALQDHLHPRCPNRGRRAYTTLCWGKSATVVLAGRRIATPQLQSPAMTPNNGQHHGLPAFHYRLARDLAYTKHLRGR